MKEIFSRTSLMIGEDNQNKLARSKVAVFGIGGVGGYVVEGLVRAGIGRIDLFDDDVVSESNLNRQIIADFKSVGRYKTEIMKERAVSINPDVVINRFDCFYSADNSSEFDLSVYDFVVDAIDTVSSKIELIKNSYSANVKIVSCMGTGNKLHPELFEIDKIENTSVCPLAKVMRRELKKLGISGVPVLYSKEEPLNVVAESSNGRHAPGSISFVPSVAGMLIAGYVVRTICNL